MIKQSTWPKNVTLKKRVSILLFCAGVMAPSPVVSLIGDGTPSPAVAEILMCQPLPGMVRSW